MGFWVETEQGCEVYKWERQIDLNYLRCFWRVWLICFQEPYIPAVVTPSETGLGGYRAIIISFSSFLASATSSLHDAGDIGAGLVGFWEVELRAVLKPTCMMLAAAVFQTLCWAFARAGRHMDGVSSWSFIWVWDHKGPPGPSGQKWSFYFLCNSNLCVWGSSSKHHHSWHFSNTSYALGFVVDIFCGHNLL